MDTENNIETPDIVGIWLFIYERRDAIVINVWLMDIENAPCVESVFVYENVIDVLTFANCTGISRETREIRVTFRSGCCKGNDATNDEVEPDTGI